MGNRTLVETMKSDGPRVYYTAEFFNTLLDHIPYLWQNGYVYPNPVTPNMAYKFRFDFHGLLNALGFPRHVFNFITVLNGFTASTDFDGETTSFYIPDNVILEKLRSTHITSDAVL